MGKKLINATVDTELIFRIDEYKRITDPAFNRSEYIEICLRSLIEQTDKNFKSKNELLQERLELINKRDSLTKDIALINSNLEILSKKNKNDQKQQLNDSKTIYDSIMANK